MEDDTTSGYQAQKRSVTEHPRFLVSLLIDNAVFVAEISARSIHVKLGDFEFARLDTNKSQSYVGTQDWLAPVSFSLGNILGRSRANLLRFIGTTPQQQQL